ncbi:MAG: M23 family metallopeptidase [Bacteroidetes bacterium]|nr:M23 family metallopeptidase [Bacteroidota bacterium]
MQLSPFFAFFAGLLFSFQLTAQTPAYLEAAQKIGLDFIWPTNASHELTSTFAEYRATHYHYGIDIKTWNQVGYDVYAAEDGFISRIRVSPTGYGKAVYITHKNGYVTVYAHLNGFAGKVKHFVLEKHYELKRNELNIFLNPKDLPVKRGELVAFTGETGIGTPHLHFEIRDPAGNELNPLRFEKGQFQDLVPPILTGFGVKPLDFSGRVNHGVEPVVYKNFRKQGTGGFILDETPVLTTNVGFLINGYDLSSGKSNQYGFHQVQLWIDGGLHYQITYDQFPVDEARYILLDRDPELLKEGLGRYTRLFEAEPNPLVMYEKPTKKAGRISGLTNGLHSGKVIVSDLFGNKTELFFNFEFRTEPEIIGPQFLPVAIKNDFSLPGFRAYIPQNLNSLIWYPVIGGKGDLEKSDLDTLLFEREEDKIRVRLIGNEIGLKDFRVALQQGTQSLLPLLVHTGKRSVYIDYQVNGLPAGQDFQIRLMNTKDQIISMKKMKFHFASNASQTRIELESGNQILFKPGSLFEPVWISVSESGKLSEFRDYRLEIGPPSVPFFSSGELQIKSVPEMGSGVGIYKFDGKYSSFIGNEKKDGYFIQGFISAGVFGFGQDTLAPILIQKVGSDKRFNEKVIEFKIKDAGSGLNTASIKVHINNQWCLAEFDPEKAILKVFTDRVKPASAYLLTLTLSDKTGNRTTDKFNWKGRQ